MPLEVLSETLPTYNQRSFRAALLKNKTTVTSDQAAHTAWSCLPYAYMFYSQLLSSTD